MEHSIYADDLSEIGVGAKTGFRYSKPGIKIYRDEPGQVASMVPIQVKSRLYGEYRYAFPHHLDCSMIRFIRCESVVFQQINQS
jgi:hypothetical protein